MKFLLFTWINPALCPFIHHPLVWMQEFSVVSAAAALTSTLCDDNTLEHVSLAFCAVFLVFCHSAMWARLIVLGSNSCGLLESLGVGGSNNHSSSSSSCSLTHSLSGWCWWRGSQGIHLRVWAVTNCWNTVNVMRINFDTIFHSHLVPNPLKEQIQLKQTNMSFKFLSFCQIRTKSEFIFI